MERSWNRYIYTVFTLLAVLCGLIWSVTNLGYDGEYQIAMSYRLLQGDRMFLEMWEPHQTSVFLPAALMWVYRGIFHTTTGIVLYLQACGIAIRGGIAFLLYRMLGSDLGKPTAYGIALLYFMVSPKDYALPEFGNLQLWFSTLLFCCLWAYLKKQKHHLLVLGAFCLCLAVLSYPSYAIVLPGVMVILALYSGHKWRDILVFTGVCACLGILVGGYFIFTIGPDVFWECISGMLALEPSHTVSAVSKAAAYLKEFFEQLLILAAVGAAGLGISLLMGALSRPAGRRRAGGRAGLWRWLLCCSVILLVGFFINIISLGDRCAYSVIFMFIVGMGLWGRKILEGREKQIYVCGSIIGGLGFLATLILTDLPLPVSAAYGLLGISFALIPIGKQAEGFGTGSVGKGMRFCFLGFVALLAFRCVYIRIPLSGRGQIYPSFSDMSMVRTGPALGIISNAEGVCIQRDSYPEWKELIRPGDKVWIVGGVVDTLGYLYEDVEVAGPSTMSTPTYSSAVLDYWRLNPDKYPDVIVAEGYLGEPAYELLANPWLLPWIEEEYRPEQVVEGKYWIYYFKNAR